MSQRLGCFTRDTAYSWVSPSATWLIPHVRQGDVNGAQPPLWSGQEDIRARGKQGEAPGGADKSKHNGAAPKNSLRPRQRKRHCCSSAMETPPCSPLRSPVPSVSAGSHGKDGTQGCLGHSRGSKLLKRLGRPDPQLPKDYCPNRAVPQPRGVMVEHPQDANAAFHLAKRSAKLEDTCPSIRANMLKDTRIHACTTQPTALRTSLQRPGSTSGTL